MDLSPNFPKPWTVIFQTLISRFTYVNHMNHPEKTNFGRGSTSKFSKILTSKSLKKLRFSASLKPAKNPDILPPKLMRLINSPCHSQTLRVCK